MKLFLILASSILLFSCETKTPQGKIPTEFVSAAKKYMGTYKGSIKTLNGRSKGVLTLSLRGSRPVIKFSGNSTNDVLGKDCRSAIGKMVSINGRKGTKRLKYATFKLDTGNCSEIPGRHIIISFDKSRKNINTSIAYKSYQGEVCIDDAGSDCHDIGNGQTVCIPKFPLCYYETRYNYLTGLFKKQ